MAGDCFFNIKLKSGDFYSDDDAFFENVRQTMKVFCGGLE
jgi:hypothetical protein